MFADGPECYTSTPNRSYSPSSSWLVSPSSPAAQRIAAAAPLVPGADLTQCLGSSHGVTESVFAIHGGIVVDDH
jgi:hypothetical protein